MSPLMEASFMGDMCVLEKLLSTGTCDIQERELDTKWTAVMYAGMGGHVHCLKRLIKAGASVNSVDRLGMTALMHTTIKGDRPACLYALLESGACVDKRDRRSNTALCYAVQNNRVSSAVVLLNSGADVEGFNGNGDTILGIATLKAQYHMMDLLLANGACVNLASEVEGRSPLMLSAENGHIGCATTLLKAGADINQRDRWGRTALTLAAARNKHGCLRLLIKNGADINAHDHMKKNALMYALRQPADYGCVKDLLRGGVDVNAASSSDAIALGYYILGHCWDPISLSIRTWVSHTSGRICHTSLPHLSRPERAILKLLCQSGSQINRSISFFEGDVPLYIPTDLYLWLHAAGYNMKFFCMDTGNQIYKLNNRLAPCMLHSWSLRDFCRDTIRSYILKLDRHGNLFLKVPQLGLPTSLGRYLLYDMDLFLR